MDKYDKLIHYQKSLMDIYNHRREYQEMSQAVKLMNTLLAIIEELIEIKKELGLKPWKNPHAVNREKLVEEFADLMHFFLQLQILLDISPEEAFLAYKKKCAINAQRQKSDPAYQNTSLPAEKIEILLTDLGN